MRHLHQVDIDNLTDKPKPDTDKCNLLLLRFRLVQPYQKVDSYFCYRNSKTHYFRGKPNSSVGKPIYFRVLRLVSG